MDGQQFQQLLQQHGGLAGNAVAIDPTVSVPNPTDVAAGVANPRMTKGPNPNPTYRYVFKDGTTIEMRGHLGNDGNPDGTFDVVQPGTALKQGGAAATKYIKGADGTIYQTDPNGNLTPVVPGASPTKPPGQIIQGKDGNSYLVGPDGSSTMVAQGPTASVNGATMPLDVAKFVWSQGLDQLNAQRADNTLSLDQWKAKVNALHNQITDQLKQQQQEQQQIADTEKYATSLATHALSPSDLGILNQSIQSLGSGHGVNYQPIQGMDPTLPMQWAQKSIGQSGNTGSIGPVPGAPPSGVPGSAAPATANAAAAGAQPPMAPRPIVAPTTQAAPVVPPVTFAAPMTDPTVNAANAARLAGMLQPQGPTFVAPSVPYQPMPR